MIENELVQEFCFLEEEGNRVSRGQKDSKKNWRRMGVRLAKLHSSGKR